jgi:hypothetical protein
VSDIPRIDNLKATVDVENKLADITWDAINDSIISSYYVDWWVE